MLIYVLQVTDMGRIPKELRNFNSVPIGINIFYTSHFARNEKSPQDKSAFHSSEFHTNGFTLLST